MGRAEGEKCEVYVRICMCVCLYMYVRNMKEDVHLRDRHID
jgi:hypothetical protein